VHSFLRAFCLFTVFGSSGIFVYKFPCGSRCIQFAAVFTVLFTWALQKYCTRTY